MASGTLAPINALATSRLRIATRLWSGSPDWFRSFSSSRCGPLAAQDISDERSAGEQVTARISRTDTPPTLDGVLDDAAWEQATVIDDFHQFNPVDHAPPSERTVVYLAYDDDNLYVAARMYDSEPDQIRARQLVRARVLAGTITSASLSIPSTTNERGTSFRPIPTACVAMARSRRRQI